MIETGIFTLLANEPSISSLVADRIYPVVLPTDGTFPAITYHIVSGTTSSALDGSGLRKLRLQIDCWAGDAYLTAATVRASVESFLGTRNLTLADGTLVSLQPIGPIDFYAGQDELFRCSFETYITFYAV